MQASIADILESPEGFANQIVNVDGILLVTDYDRDSSAFQHVWLVQQEAPQNLALRAQPISSESTLWHGLSRLNPRYLPGYQTIRVHDAVRACVRVIGAADTPDAPMMEILTAAVYRHEFTLYVGDQGVRLDQALPAHTPIQSLPEIQANIPRFLGRRCHIYGTLIIRSSPPAQFLQPGHIPYSDAFRSTVNHLEDSEVETDWLADIEYPQSDSEHLDEGRLPDSIHIDQHYPIKEQLSVLPGINQTIVKPAIVAGTLSARDHDEHFATLTEIEDVYLQNIVFADSGKSLESVIKLKNFEEIALEI